MSRGEGRGRRVGGRGERGRGGGRGESGEGVFVCLEYITETGSTKSRMWVDVGRCGSMWVGVGRCGSAWVDVGRCGSM